jgi:hypothetical protein
MKIEITFDIEPKQYSDFRHEPTQKEVKEYISRFMNRRHDYDESAYFRNVKVVAKRK